MSGQTIPVMDIWTARKIGLASGSPLTRQAIESYQLEALNRTLELAYSSSSFYKEKFGNVRLSRLSDMSELPFTVPGELISNPLKMLCVSPGEISRIVTLFTSGSSGRAKRVYFTRDDQELCVDFFHHGMQNLVDKTDTVGIFFPAQRPGSVGELLKKGLDRLGASSFTLFERLPEDKLLIEYLNQIIVTSLAGPPSIIKRLAELCLSDSSLPRLAIKSVLLSADFVSAECRKTIKDAWEPGIFEHYGMTEMGLGCAVSCKGQLKNPDKLAYHVREADIYIEIIDPVTGSPQPEGKTGEIVFTTLTRKGMPFIRYRTGDMSRWVSEACPCGSKLKLLARVGDRGIKKAI